MLLRVALTALSCVAVAACAPEDNLVTTPQLTESKSANPIELSSPNLTTKRQNFGNEDFLKPSASSEDSPDWYERDYSANRETIDSDQNLTTAASSASYMTLVPMGLTNTLGNPLYELRLYANGQLVGTYKTVVGRAHTQTRNRHQSGTEAPLPDGTYRVARTTVPGTIVEAGDRFLSIEPLFHTGRSALGIHYDPSYEKRNGEDGTSGCIGLTNRADLDLVLNYVRTYQPQYLQVAIQ